MVDLHQHLEDPHNHGKEISSIESSEQFGLLLLNHEKRMRDLGFEKVNIIFNKPEFLFNKAFEEGLVQYIQKGQDGIFFTLMVDYQNSDSLLRLKELRERNLNISGVKFHPILQRIGRNHFEKVLEVAKIASGENMFVMVDGSYGALSIYQYGSIGLADFLCRHIKTPVILAHSGTVKIKEAFLIGLETPNQNLYFDSSFILSFWKGSSLELDFIFALRKLGMERFCFGSDCPYYEVWEEYKQQTDFLSKNGFSEDQKKDFLSLSEKIIECL